MYYIVRSLLRFTLALFVFQQTLQASLQEEVQLVYDCFSEKVHERLDEQEALRLFTDREELSVALRKKLLSKYGEASRLFVFPDLDRDTFNESIKILSTMNESRPEVKNDALLHVWSYLTGIRVIGVKKGANYYESNLHIKKYSKAASDIQALRLQFSPQSIYVKRDGQDSSELLIAIPDDFRLRSAYFKSCRGNESLEGIPEDPAITWEFLQSELVPLHAFLSDKLAHVKILLDRVLKMRKEPTVNTPLFSHGLVNLLRNTAIYLSLEGQNDSQVVVGSFSIVSTNNLGLQDGIFLEKRAGLEGAIDYLFGCQIFNRLFFRNYREQIWRQKKLLSGAVSSKKKLNEVDHAESRIKGPICTEFVPHFELTSVSAEVQNSFIEKGDDAFAKKFRGYMKANGDIIGGGNHGNFNKPYDQLPNMIAELNTRQLLIRLISEDELVKAVGTVWFEPDTEIDLSGGLMRRKYGNSIADDSLLKSIRKSEGEVLLPISKLILHLTCYPYRFIKNLDLSENYIANEGAQALGNCFAQGVLPSLVILDLSNNKITDFKAASFGALIRRYEFRYLVVLLNPFDSISPAFESNDLLKKVIFISKESLTNNSIRERFPQDILLLHDLYYKQDNN